MPLNAISLMVNVVPISGILGILLLLVVSCVCSEIVGFGVGVGRDRFLIQFLPIEFILFEILKIWQR